MAAKSSLFTYNEETIVRPISPSILTILLLNLQTSKTDTKSVKLNFGPGQNICFALKDKTNWLQTENGEKLINRQRLHFHTKLIKFGDEQDRLRILS